MDNIPMGWTSAEVKELCTLINGRAFKPAEWDTIGKPIIRIQNLNNIEAPYNHFDGQIDEKFHVATGDLLFAWSGTPGTSFGAHIWNGPEAYLNQHIFRVVFDSSLINKKYFRFALNERLENIISRAHGGVGLRHITKGKFEQTKIHLPPFNEQKRIADKIEALQAKSKKAKKALETAKPLLDKLRQSILASAFRGDLTADWRKKNPGVEPASVLLERIRAERQEKWEENELVKMRAKGKEPKNDKWKSKYKKPASVDTTALPDLPRGWMWAKIEDLVSLNRPGIKTGPFGSLLKKNEHKREGIPVLGIENIGKMVFIPGPKIYISEKKAAQLKDYSIDSGDLIVSRSGTVGEVCVIPDNIGICRFSTNIIRVSLYRSIMIPELMGYQFIGSEIVKKQIAKLCSGSTRDFLNKTIMSSIIFPVPPIEEQKQIVEKIRSLLLKRDSIRKMIDTCYQESDKLDQSILIKAFRGELVSQYLSDEPATKLLERIQNGRKK